MPVFVRGYVVWTDRMKPCVQCTAGQVVHHTVSRTPARLARTRPAHGPHMAKEFAAVHEVRCSPGKLIRRGPIIYTTFYVFVFHNWSPPVPTGSIRVAISRFWPPACCPRPCANASGVDARRRLEFGPRVCNWKRKKDFSRLDKFLRLHVSRGSGKKPKK